MPSVPVARPSGLQDLVPLTQLELDANNPRLASGLEPGETPTQEALVRVLWEEMAVDEVALSIARNGFYPEERLLVIPQSPGAGGPRYVVVEGNRRLAAVRLLTDAALRKRIKADVLPRLSQEDAADLERLPVSVYPTRESLWEYLGFRHINGTRPWDAYSKAQYVARVHEEYGVPLDEIAAKIGDRHATVQRLYRGLKVLDQAVQDAGFDVDDRIRSKFSFSHLYTALDQPEFQKYLGMTAKEPLRPRPVPRNRLSELGQLMTWLYGQKSTATQPVVLSQNPDLGRLRSVLASPSALSMLRTGASLSSAFEASLGDERRFRDSVVRAREELIRASGTVTTGYRGNAELLRSANDILTIAAELVERMKAAGERSRSARRDSDPSAE